MLPDLYLRLGLSLAIGLLIGLQRERVKEGPAGIRTFALISLSGFVVGILAAQFDGWIIAAAILFLAIMIGIGNFLASRKKEDYGTGTTTEISALLVFSIGAYLAHPEGSSSLAVVIAGITALLLYYKQPMHHFVQRMDAEDLRAIMQFVLISAVILPVLPNQTFGPYEVLNPFKTWLMVVLIVGIGLAGYIAYQFAGSRVGTLLSGVLGGLISSTATTVSAARDAGKQRSHVIAATLIIMIASVLSLVRVLIEIAAVTPANFAATAPPISLFLAVFVLLTFLIYRGKSAEIVHLDPPQNPAELSPAIIFGILYAVILLGIAAAKEHLGQTGLYVVAVFSGLTDMDAITLSTSELMSNDSLDTATGWRVILLAAMSNLAFKAGIVGVVGHRALLKRVALFYGIALLAGTAIFFLWPG